MQRKIKTNRIAEHTPTPWVSKGDLITSPSAMADVAIVQFSGNDAEDEANPEFIVLACNSYHGMVAALSEIERFAMSAEISPKGTGRDHIADIARVALAKATP